MVRTSSIQHISLDKLLLDEETPRFGGNLDASNSQKSLLETIVEKHGVNDLLASMSANGYFNAEPVVAVRTNKNFTVVEGNRRLAAAIILTGDSRGLQFKDLAQKWICETSENTIASLRGFPVSVFKSESSMVGGRGSNLDYPFSWVYTSSIQFLMFS